MDCEEIARLLRAELPDCEIAVSGGEGKFMVRATGPVFAGLNAVKRQQKIYAILNNHILGGAIHAVSMNLKAPTDS